MSSTMVRTISTATIHAPSTTHTPQTISLTPWELRLLLVDPIQKGLIFTKPQQLQEDSFTTTSLISHLKASLSTTLAFFPPLTGRLIATPHDANTTVSYHIACNNQGAMFVHATAEGVRVGDIRQDGFVPSVVYDLFTLNGAQNYEGTTLPLLGVQVTELDDGVFIGCSMNHAVADGGSFWHFVNCWAEISRGVDSLSRPPVIDRKFLSDLCPDIRIPIEHHKKQLKSHNNVKEKVYHYSKKNIAMIKDKANSETAGAAISSLQAVLAHLWRTVIRNTINLDPDIELTYRLPAGLRQRMKSVLHENYFGCAVLAGIVTMKAGELLGKGLGHAAMQLNKIVNSDYTEEKCMAFLKSWIENPELVRHGANEARNIHAAMLTNNSPRFDVYGNDFGWGKPLAARSGISFKGGCGVVTVYPGVEEEGSVDIEVCILGETLEAMENDSEFMEAFSV